MLKETLSKMWNSNSGLAIKSSAIPVFLKYFSALFASPLGQEGIDFLFSQSQTSQIKDIVLDLFTTSKKPVLMSGMITASALSTDANP
ncbi:hypothetical protein ES703_72292 [subsurface metagenome]